MLARDEPQAYTLARMLDHPQVGTAQHKADLCRMACQLVGVLPTNVVPYPTILFPDRFLTLVDEHKAKRAAATEATDRVVLIRPTDRRFLANLPWGPDHPLYGYEIVGSRASYEGEPEEFHVLEAVEVHDSPQYDYAVADEEALIAPATPDPDNVIDITRMSDESSSADS